jgi:predicted outer membrane protein
MQTKELDMLIIHVGVELKLHKTLSHFLVAQLQDLEPKVSRKH